METPPTGRPARRPRHLLDPADPRPAARDPRALERLHRVQRWVLSTLAVTTGLHFAFGLVLSAAYLDASDRPGARVGLLVIAALLCVGSIAAGLAIHRHRVLSPWLLLGLVPSILGAYWIYG